MTPEFRKCPVTGRSVIIAPDRALRPIALNDAQPIHRRDRDGRAVCPFCEGQEHDTPDESYALRKPDSVPNGPGWTLRVVPNKFPAVAMPPSPLGGEGLGERGRPVSDNADSRCGHHPSPLALLPQGERGIGFGVHECVIETPAHVTNPTALTDDQFAAVLIAWRERVRSFATDDRLVHVTPFKNVGAEAGASLAHLHSQIIALPFVPDAVRDELAGAARYHRVTGRCVFCDLQTEPEARARAETPSLAIRAQDRVILAERGFTALCPIAPRFGYETWVMPTVHASGFESLSDDEALTLGRVLKGVLAAIDRVLAEPAYNLYVHTAPLRSGPLPHYHWHIEVIPRTARAAGFEWGSGVFINAVPPERAAAELRACLSG